MKPLPSLINTNTSEIQESKHISLFSFVDSSITSKSLNRSNHNDQNVDKNTINKLYTDTNLSMNICTINDRVNDLIDSLEDTSEKDLSLSNTIVNTKFKTVTEIWKQFINQTQTVQLLGLKTVFPKSYLNIHTNSSTKIHSTSNLEMNSFYTFKPEKSFLDLINQYHSFPDESYNWVYTPEELKSKRKEVLSGTYYIQHEIWNNQHPKKCENGRFLFVYPQIWGIGSQFHILSIFLSWAIDHNLILQYVPNSNPWIDKDFCQSETTYDCYFAPLTQCKFSEDFFKKLNTLNDDELKQYKMCKLESLNEYVSDPKFSDCQYGFFGFKKSSYRYLMNYTPKLVTDLLASQHVNGIQALIYWRIQSITYLMRYNEQTQNWINNYIHDHFHNYHSIYDFSIHIRHGDKGREMKLIESEDYDVPIQLLEKILKENASNYTIFVNSDDSESMNYFIQKYPNLSYFDEKRQDLAFHLLRQVKHIMLVSLTNLKQQIKGYNTIGTFKSNWNRLIFELKSTVGYNNNGFYFEAGDYPYFPYTEYSKYRSNIPIYY